MPSGDIRVEASAGQVRGSLKMASVKFVFVLPRNGLLPKSSSYLPWRQGDVLGSRVENIAYHGTLTRKRRETTNRRVPSTLSS